jgi:hypothetical protein
MTTNHVNNKAGPGCLCSYPPAEDPHPSLGSYSLDRSLLGENRAGSYGLLLSY